MPSSQTIPVFHVADLDRAIRHYVGVMGFTETFRYGPPGQPPRYAGVRRGDLDIHLNAFPEAQERRGKGAAYVLLPKDGVDAVHAEVMPRGAILVGAPPTTYDYGMRDVKYADPDGNWLSFGEDAASVPCS